MRQLSLLLGIGMLAGVLTPAFAQNNPAPEKVRFESADGVQLQGTFYGSSKTNPPAVLMLHALGEDSKKKGWTLLAEELQKRGFAVLTFDFRGHGLSTDLNDEKLFWANRANASLVKGFPKATSIDYAGFNRAYYSYLCNDIAAARAYLDRKNDAGACNMSNLILIGADTGATLGAIWLHAEYYRVRLKPRFAGDLRPVPENRAEGNDAIGCVWLGINDKLGGTALTLSNTLYLPGKVKAVPMTFWYGEKDKKGKIAAEKLVDNLVAYKKKGKDKEREEKYKLTSAVEVAGSKLSGSELLQKGLKTEKFLADYLELVVQEKNTEWVAREFLKTAYGWRSKQGQVFPANKKGEKNLYFKNDYNSYR